MRKIWPFTFNLLLFAAIASVFPFLVLYYQGLGFTGTQIGVLTGINPLISFFSAPLWTGLADAKHLHRLMMSIAILVAAITLFVFPFFDAFLLVLLIAVLLYFFVAPITPFADSATMSMLAGEKEMYGRIRLGGTIGFGLAAFIVGIIVQNFGMRLAFWISATFLLVGFAVSQKLVYSQLSLDGQVRGRVRALLANPRWILFLFVAFAGRCHIR